jgi:hypothetical protein
MSCSGKKSYATEELANVALYTTWSKAKPGAKLPIRSYYCRLCGRWHLTSQEKRSAVVDVIQWLIQQFKER